MIFALTLIVSIHVVCCDLEGYILQGKEAKIHKYPHSIYMSITCNKHSYICGASILNQRVVLTAAHCVEECKGKSTDTVILKYGHAEPPKMFGTQMKMFKIHERYDTDSLENDIALVTGRRVLPLGSTVRRVALTQATPRNKMAYIAGWGVTNKLQDVAFTLQDIVQEIQPRSVCKLVGNLHPGAFCAGSISGPGAPDLGDSGSALMVRQFIQIGIVSYKVDLYSLVVYTNVSYYYNWIQRTAMNLYCS